MAYTPINWQTGDTITAEKMNKMDNGWSVTDSIVICFDDSVIVQSDGGFVSLEVVSGDFSSAEEITATVNGLAYNLTGFDDGGYWTFGAPYGDYSTYTFSISFAPNSTTPEFVAQQAGTYTLKIETLLPTVETSADFTSAVKSVVKIAPFLCVNGITKIEEANTAKNNGQLLYFWTENSGCFFIHDIGSSCVIYPESQTVSAYFDRDFGVFNVVEA